MHESIRHNEEENSTIQTAKDFGSNNMSQSVVLKLTKKRKENNWE